MVRRNIVAAVAVCGALLSIGGGSGFAADPCDRACLQGHIDKVLAAMIAHNPSQLMFARTASYTDNGVELRIGDGLWGTASARSKYNLYVCDTDAG
jgi:hypothetical protein